MSGPTTPSPASPAATPAPRTTTIPATVPLPLGFSAQLKGLQEGYLALSARITALEHENALLKAALQQHSHRPRPQHPPSPLTDPNLLSRIAALEAHNAHLTHRRREAVSQLLNLRTLHQESANAFLLRAKDIQDDDLEGVLGVWGTSVTTVMNSQQRVLGVLRGAGYGTGGGGGVARGYAYPPSYAQSGYCFAHGAPYPCRCCGQ